MSNNKITLLSERKLIWHTWIIIININGQIWKIYNFFIKYYFRLIWPSILSWLLLELDSILFSIMCGKSVSILRINIIFSFQTSTCIISQVSFPINFSQWTHRTHFFEEWSLSRFLLYSKKLLGSSDFEPLTFFLFVKYLTMLLSV